MSLIAYANGILLADRVAGTELSQTQKLDMPKLHVHEKNAFALAYCGRQIYGDELQKLMTSFFIITCLNCVGKDKVLDLFGFFEKRYFEDRVYLLMTRDRIFMSYGSQGFIMTEQKEPVVEGTLGDAFVVAVTAGLTPLKAAKEATLLAYGHESQIDYVRQSSLKRISAAKRKELERVMREEGL